MVPVGIGIVLLGFNWSTPVLASPIGYHAPYGFLALIVIAGVYASVGAFVLARQPGVLRVDDALERDRKPA